MPISIYQERVKVLSIEEFAVHYPQYAPFAQQEGKVLFEILTTPKAFVMAKAASKMNLPAILGIAELCNSEFQNISGHKPKRFLSQFVGAVVCSMMESNGFIRSGKKKSITHPNFSKCEFFVEEKSSNRKSLELEMIKALQQWTPLQKSTGTIQVIDFFCGCGGMSLGFAASGKCKMLGGVDINADAVASYERNIGGSGIQQNIVELYEDEELFNKFIDDIKFDGEQPSIIIGCAPCQGFSAHRKKHRGPDDERNSLVGVFASIAVQFSPNCIVMENVPELLSDKYAAYFHEAKSTFEAYGYKVLSTIVNAAEFGVPQARFRSILLAMKKDFSFPEALYNSSCFKTVRNAIGHLMPIKAGETCETDCFHKCANHRQSTIDTIKQVPLNGGSRPKGVGPKCLDKVNGFYDVYGRLDWDKPAITITHYARNPASGRFVHPEQHRGLSLREMALLQSFPENFVFTGTFDAIAKQIGEAVPPALSAAVAGSVFWDLNLVRDEK